jgi:hypothetical protein
MASPITIAPPLGFFPHPSSPPSSPGNGCPDPDPVPRPAPAVAPVGDGALLAPAAPAPAAPASAAAATAPTALAPAAPASSTPIPVAPAALAALALAPLLPPPPSKLPPNFMPQVVGPPSAAALLLAAQAAPAAPARLPPPPDKLPPTSSRTWLGSRVPFWTRWVASRAGRRCMTIDARSGTSRPLLLVMRGLTGTWPSGGGCVADASDAWSPATASSAVLAA